MRLSGMKPRTDSAHPKEPDRPVGAAEPQIAGLSFWCRLKAAILCLYRPSALKEAAVSVNHYERTFRAWPLLTDRAEKRSKISYGEVAEHLQIHHRPVRYVLGVIQDWCLRERKPPLTILVISQGEGKPGQGFIAWDSSNLNKGYEEVYASAAHPPQSVPVRSS